MIIIMQTSLLMTNQDPKLEYSCYSEFLKKGILLLKNRVSIF